MLLNSMTYNNQNYSLEGNNFYNEKENFNGYNEESCIDHNMEHMHTNNLGKKLPFNNQSKSLFPSKFPVHSNITNSFLASNLTTEKNSIKGNYLNKQVNIEKKDEVPEFLRLLSKKGGIYSKLINKFNH